MSYSAEISRSNPSCFLFLIDQSGSMQDPFGSGETQKRKADGVTDVINRLLQELVLKCAKSEGIRDYYHVGVIGYGAKVGPAFISGNLSGKELIPISEVATYPARLDERMKRVDDGIGGLIDQSIKFPVWFDPIAENGTPMCQAFSLCHSILSKWLSNHSDCFPPTVINITDGESTDGDPTMVAEKIKGLSSSDGNVLLMNVHLSSQKSSPIMFPNDGNNLIDQYAQLLFTMSSILPPHILRAAQQSGYSVLENSRGFAFNTDLIAFISFLDIGTRPSNLR